MTRPQTTSDAGHLRRLPPPKSFFSKFASPLFSSKQRSPVDHEIRLDEPFRQFFSGDSVKGAVVVNAAKPFRITHLVIRLHGFVKVVNNARLPGETVPYDENLLTSMRNRRGIEYFGNGFARLFEEESILCGDGRLFGKYQFRFDLTIPSSIVPSSIDVRFLGSKMAMREELILCFLVRAWNDLLSAFIDPDPSRNNFADLDDPPKAQSDGKHRHCSIAGPQIPYSHH